MRNKALIWSGIVSIGGFLFGFDTAVISGAEQSIQQYWSLSPFQHGLTVSMALIGTIFGALLGSYPAEKWGRSKTLSWIAVLYLVSSIGTAMAQHWGVFLVFRFLGGLGVGASSVAAPIYISEIAPADKRGKLVALFQFNIVLGILVSYLSNYLIGQESENAWRWMLGVQAAPSLVYLLLLNFIPESPRWLLLHTNKREEAGQILRQVNPSGYMNDIAAIEAAATEAQQPSSVNLFSRQHRFQVFLAVSFAVFNQVSGINAIIYYAPRIFEMTGLGRHAALLSSVGIGSVNFLFTLLALQFIDRFGRKTLMLIGSFGLIATLALVSRAFFINDFSDHSVIILLLIYIAFFAFSQGSVIWVFIAEIFPNQVRAKGQTLGSLTHWVMAAAIAFVFPLLAESIGGGATFAFFAIMMILQLIFVWKIMPETKGHTLEQIDKTLAIHG